MNTNMLPVSLFVLLGTAFLWGCKGGNVADNTQWPNYLGDKSSAHYSGLSQIDTGNAAGLKVAWIYRTGDADTPANSQIQCNPLVIDGILYGTSPKLKLFALNAATGEEKWTFDPFAGTEAKKAGIHVNRGVAYWSDHQNKRIFYTAGPFLYSVDAVTGKPVASFGNEGKVSLHEGYGRDVNDLHVVATSPGVIYKNLLIMGTSVSETNPAVPGDIRAYDVNSGKIEWIFHTIPRPGEEGNDTWEDSNAWQYTGGVNNWSGMSLDEQRGMVYIPLGSATFDFYGGLRKGQNLFSDCLVALDAAKGKLLWYFQTVHHDLWDRDLPAPPNLVTILKDGKKVDAVAQITKTGYTYVFDRVTGKPLFPIQEVPVPTMPALEGEQVWPTQPRPELPEPFVKQEFDFSSVNNLVPDSSQQFVRNELALLETNTEMFTPPSEKGTVIFPGFDGGGEWGGAAFDQGLGLLYVNANQIPWSLKMVRNNSPQKAGEQTMGAYGRTVYRQNCMACHGVNKEGGGNYPSLQGLNARYTKNIVLDIINNGRGRMPAFKEISPDDKDALLSYLLDLKNKDAIHVSKDTGTTPNLMPFTMTGYNKIRTPEGYPGNMPPWGTLSAIDLSSGKISWQIPLGEYPELTKKGIPITGTENYGGPVVTAGGILIIASTPDQKIRIFNKRTGKPLWEALLPAAGFATPATYMRDGKQYIVIACGGGKLGAKSGDAYVAFSLPGK